MVCSHCGRDLASAARFCDGCGRPVPASSLITDFIQDVQDVVSVSLREAVLVDKITGSEILKSPVFRFVFFLAMGPLAIALLRTNNAILYGLAIYSALLWSMFLYRLFADKELSFRWAIGTVLFTCFAMVPILELYLRFPIDITGFLISTGFLPLQFIGYTLGVGLREEMCKAVPLLLLALLTTRMQRPLNGLVLGMMSGVGFAVAENVYYVYRTVTVAMTAVEQGQMGALVMPVYNNVIRMTMGPFVHGCLSGIFGYFIGVATATRGSRVLLFLIGLGLSSFLHGVYDTLVGRSPLFGLAVQAVTYFLLMTYILKARGLASARQLGGGVFSRTVVLRAPTALPAEPAAAAAPAQASVPSARETPAQSWQLRSTAGPVSGQVFPLSGETRLGRDASRCAVHISEAAVSREHASLALDAVNGGWRLRRLSRTKPVFVNGTEADDVPLRAGDQIQIGSSVFVLEPSGPR